MMSVMETIDDIYVRDWDLGVLFINKYYYYYYYQYKF